MVNVSTFLESQFKFKRCNMQIRCLNVLKL